MIKIVEIKATSHFQDFFCPVLEDEAARASEMLRGKVVARVIRHRPTEVLLEFTDGTQLFVDQAGDALELSNTGGK